MENVSFFQNGKRNDEFQNSRRLFKQSFSKTKRKFQAKTFFFFNDEKMVINNVFKLEKCTRQSQFFFCQTINILFKCNYLFTGMFYTTSKGSYQRFLVYFLKMMEKTTFCRFVFVFSKQKTKRQVSGWLFWFENKIVDVVLSNCFRKPNETKMSFYFEN